MSRRPDPAQQRMGGLAFGEPVQATLTGEDVPHRDVIAEQAEARRAYSVRLNGGEVARYACFIDAEAHALDLAPHFTDGAVSVAEVAA